MQRIKTLSENELIKKLSEFSEQAGIHLNENMFLLVQFLQINQGNLYIEVLEAAFSRFLKGIINIKTPYRLNNRFISELINGYFEIKRTSRQDIPADKDDDPSPERINKIMEAGHKYTLIQYHETFYNKNTKLISVFFLENKYTWLLEQKRFEFSWFDETSITNKIKILQRWEANVSNHHNIKLPLPNIDYKKAAYVALYYDYLINAINI